MKNKAVSILLKVLIFFALVYLLMLENEGDIKYLYANF